MRIGELAKRAGVNVQTIRFYERETFLPPPPRTESGYRQYSERDLQRVIFIRECQHLGFTLKEIAQLAPLHDALAGLKRGDKRPLESLSRMAAERLRTIDERIAALRTMRGNLERMIDPGWTDAPECPAQRRAKI